MLHTPIFEQIRVEPSYIERPIALPQLGNLRDLRIRLPNSWEDFIMPSLTCGNMSAMMRALRKYLPNIETFEWKLHWTADPMTGCDTFRNLKRLRRLRIDYSLLFGPSSPATTPLEQLKEILLPSLEDLVLDNVCH